MRSSADRPLGRSYHPAHDPLPPDLHQTDGRVEESSVDGDGPIMMGSYFKLLPHADHWWKVVALRWGAEGGGVAELESTTLPAQLRKLEAT